jgi:hypothetical protein
MQTEGDEGMTWEEVEGGGGRGDKDGCRQREMRG